MTKRSGQEYRQRLDEACVAAGRLEGEDWNNAFFHALVERGLTLASSVHPHDTPECYPSGGPYIAPSAYEAVNAWPADSRVVWGPQHA